MNHAKNQRLDGMSVVLHLREKLALRWFMCAVPPLRMLLGVPGSFAAST